MNDALSFTAGFTLGILSGLLPGLHPNTLIAILSSFGLDNGTLSIMIIALFPASIIASFIPAIFLGIPDPTTVVSVLPGQRMVLEGKGIQAIKTVLIACIISAVVSSLFFYFSIGLFQSAYAMLKDYVKYIVLAFTIILLARSRNPLNSFAIFLLSGALGWFSLGSQMQDPFLPLFSGMFALAAMLSYKKSAVPEQKEDKPADCFGFALIGVALGIMAAFFPAIGSPTQMATFATIFLPFSSVGFLATISSIDVSQGIFSLSTSASIDKSRVGEVVWLGRYIDIGKNLPLLLTCFVLSMAFAVMLVYAVRGKIARLASLDFTKLNLVLAAYICATTYILDGPVGIAVLAVSAALGWITLRSGVERTNMMGSIILPTLLLLFRIFF